MKSNLTFKKISNDRGVIDYLSDVISKHLDWGDRVLWLVSGGSAIKIAALVSSSIEESLHIDNLTVSLIDERFGPVGHKDSNWQQLEESGFRLKKTSQHPILIGTNSETTAKRFENWLENSLRQADFRLGLLGMGPDGHTSGILPRSPAIDSAGLVCVYSAPDYQRITTTPKALKALDEAVVYALGESKWPQLERLNQDLSLEEQPAQIFKRIKKVTVFNDFREGEL